MSLTKITLFEEEPRWVATRLKNTMVYHAVNWGPGPQAWKDAATEAFYQLNPIQSACLTHPDDFQHAQVPDQRDPRFLAYLANRRDVHSQPPQLQQNNEGTVPA